MLSRWTSDLWSQARICESVVVPLHAQSRRLVCLESQRQQVEVRVSAAIVLP